MILILDLIFFFLNFFFSIDSHWGRAGSEGGASGVNVTVLSSSMSSKEALRRQTVSEIWLSLDAVEMRLRQEVNCHLEKGRRGRFGRHGPRP